MTREDILFFRVLSASMVLHLLGFVVVYVLPPRRPVESVHVYTVRIMEAPAQPTAQGLQLSTAAISALKLEAPSLRASETPQLESPGAPPGDPISELRAPVAPPEAPQAQTPASAVPAQPPPPQAPLRDVPAIPGVPRQPPPAAAGAPAPPAVDTAASTLQAPPAGGQWSGRAPLEEVREKVRKLNLRIENDRKPGVAPRSSAEMTSLLSLRRYQTRLQTAVHENYTFPGGFPPGLIARVRVVLARDGSARSVEMLESSGNEKFDYAVLLTLRNTRFPPVPPEVPGETITQVFLFSPQ